MNDKRLRLIQLRASGHSYQSVAEEIGISKPTAIKWAQEMKDFIADHRAVELDALMKALEITTEAKLRSLSTLLQRTQAELDKRDFADVETTKLLDLVIKLTKELDVVSASIALKDKFSMGPGFDFEQEYKESDI